MLLLYRSLPNLDAKPKYTLLLYVFDVCRTLADYGGITYLIKVQKYALL